MGGSDIHATEQLWKICTRLVRQFVSNDLCNTLARRKGRLLLVDEQRGFTVCDREVISAEGGEAVDVTRTHK